MKNWKEVKRVLCVGMPVADVLISGARTQDVMQRYAMQPAVRNMLSVEQIHALEREIASAQEGMAVDIVAGGSLANTACAIAGLHPSLQLHYFAACAKDHYGDIFLQGLHQAGISPLPAQRIGSETSRSYVISDATGERAIARYLGDSMSDITLAHLRTAIDDVELVVLEGELPSLPQGVALWREIVRYAKAQGKLLGFSLFGAEQVAKHRDLFMETITDYADIVCGNEQELHALWKQENPDLFTSQCEATYALMQQRADHAVLCISHGASAPYLATQHGLFRTAPLPVSELVNTLGAGDGFMAGLLAGLLQGLPEERALALGHGTAAAVLKQAAPQLSSDSLAILRQNHAIPSAA